MGMKVSRWYVAITVDVSSPSVWHVHTISVTDMQPLIAVTMAMVFILAMMLERTVVVALSVVVTVVVEQAKKSTYIMCRPNYRLLNTASS